MNYCSHCGSSQLAYQIPEGDDRLRWVCGQCGTIHYSNPKIVAGCLPVWGEKVLLCKRAIEPGMGLWNVPSGYLENGESIEEGAMREVWEEALARVELTGLHAVYSIPHISQVYIHFLGNLVDGRFGVGPESLDARLFAEEEIPWEQIAFTSSVFTLRHFFDDRKKGLPEVHVGSYGK